MNAETIREAAEALDVLTSNIHHDAPARVEAAREAKQRVEELYEAADAFEARTAEAVRLREALEVANAEVSSLHQRIIEQEETVEQLQDANAALRGENRQLKLELESIGAGGVSSQRITSTDARWYAVSADGMATLCINREDARDAAAEAALCYPNNSPYTAVQMVPVGDGETFGGKS